MISKAKEMLIQGKYTCVILNNNEIYTSRDRGVKPLLDWYNNVDSCGGVAADKVVGKAAAFLYVLMDISEIYAKVISRPAYEVLKNYGVKITYDEIVDAIRNRSNTGFCPMESSVWEINEPIKAYEVIVETRNMLQNS